MCIGSTMCYSVSEYVQCLEILQTEGFHSSQFSQRLGSCPDQPRTKACVTLPLDRQSRVVSSKQPGHAQSNLCSNSNSDWEDDGSQAAVSLIAGDCLTRIMTSVSKVAACTKDDINLTASSLTPVMVYLNMAFEEGYLLVDSDMCSQVSLSWTILAQCTMW